MGISSPQCPRFQKPDQGSYAAFCYSSLCDQVHSKTYAFSLLCMRQRDIRQRRLRLVRLSLLSLLKALEIRARPSLMATFCRSVPSSQNQDALELVHSCTSAEGEIVWCHHVSLLLRNVCQGAVFYAVYSLVTLFPRNPACSCSMLRTYRNTYCATFLLRE